MRCPIPCEKRPHCWRQRFNFWCFSLASIGARIHLVRTIYQKQMRWCLDYKSLCYYSSTLSTGVRCLYRWNIDVRWNSFFPYQVILLIDKIPSIDSWLLLSLYWENLTYLALWKLRDPLPKMWNVLLYIVNMIRQHSRMILLFLNWIV